MFLEGKAKLIGAGLIVVIAVMLSTWEQDIKKYAVVSHTRLNDNSGINSEIAKADLSKFDVLMLGGDMANLSSLNDSILHYLDLKFDISNPKTLWALGNHDYSNVKLLKTYTKKETFYTYAHDNTVFIVLDTQLDSSRISGEQLAFFNSVLDTISSYKNLIVLTHKLIWMRNHSILEPMIDSVSNGHYGDCSYCIQDNNFYEAIYLRLVKLQEGGIDVYCVAGDVGHKASSFDYVTNEGVTFLATGVNANQKNNYYLEFESILEQGVISYRFKPLESLAIKEW